MEHPSDRGRSIPSLDGLRAIAVGLVVLFHLRAMPDFLALTHGYADYLAPIGLLGVRIFFVISGFLITNLLITEMEGAGTIRLGRFYVRRTLRIFPAYYVMLAIAALLGSRGIVDTVGAHWNWLVSYASNLGPDQPPAVGHAWSLGVEEQFYLLWPPLLLLAGRARGLHVAVGVVLLMAVARLATFALFHSARLTFATPFDFLAVGCALSLAGPQLATSTRWHRLMAARWPVLLLPLVALYALWFGMATRWRFAFDLIVGQSLTAVTIAVAIAWCVRNAPRHLNNRPIRALGVLSYSIYLFQELWLRPAPFPWYVAIAGTLVSAIASYFVIERPFLALRKTIERNEWSNRRIVMTISKP